MANRILFNVCRELSHSHQVLYLKSVLSGFLPLPNNAAEVSREILLDLEILIRHAFQNYF